MAKKKSSKPNSSTSTAPKTLISFTEPKSYIAEQFKTLRTNINFTLPGDDAKKLLVTSTIPGEGKSTITANLGFVFAQEGKRVLIIDADLRKPTLHATFNLPNKIGLSNMFTKQVSFVHAIKETFIYDLYVLPSGPVPLNPSELLSSKTMDQFLKTIEDYFDVIIFDAPPILTVTDAQILSNKCDGTVLVINSGTVNRKELLKAKSALLSSHANILGVVLNNFNSKTNNYYEKLYKS
ncbi:CpsD/CapB family tyrosine-protein kinase [Ureibacillus manganicus]|uniref:non-specific protein-tyrosine kinase n=1 Tax=Ureibacillus manganicus DSM 26584 TaxID=1384049 RepID=A0A0A3HUS9_9BACL|nr:CpsD/CapB family tyrosine-protein kinase [Ureibacillus manganicus]KGR76204.1 capsular biosynthesis protein [Ureibacillus manganicus DSM 26584]